MELKPGTRIGPYEIEVQIGAGGMGEVYRALDTKLQRAVAIKRLPEEYAADPERLARFEREARLLASLNHPRIAAIYGLEEVDQKRYLVLELVPGETLAERIARGPLQVEEAVGTARQIAEALAAAHERGVVHRDLKPANVKITPEGEVKVLDFGLAKALPTDRPGKDATQSPTIPAATAAGTILGTPAYMSPEQARGHGVDKRTDVWSFACVLFEMLAGRRTFAGDSAIDILVKVLETEPDWASLPAGTPPRVREILLRCLTKDPKRRRRDMGDLALELADLPDSIESVPPLLGRRVSIRGFIVIAAAVVIAGILGIWWGRSQQEKSPQPVVRLALTLPEDAPLYAAERSALAISPDGSTIVYAGGDVGQTRLLRRDLNALQVVALENTDGAVEPFFSPDGATLGFFVAGVGKRMDLGGGTVQVVGDGSPVVRGALWADDGSLILNSSKSVGLWRMELKGGGASMISQPDPEKLEGGHCWPQLLPGGRTALVTSLSADASTYDEARILAIDLAGGESQVLIEGGSFARYVASGHLLFVRDGTLLAVAMDLERLEVQGEPRPVVNDVFSNPASGVAHYAVSETGILVYARGEPRTSSNHSLIWVDRDGGVEPVVQEHATYGWPRPSPDGRRLAVAIEGAHDDIWVLDLERGASRRLTFEGRNVMPIWSPDGQSITYSSVRTGFPAVYQVLADGSGAPKRLVFEDTLSFPGSWTPDGETLAYSAVIEGSYDILLLTPGEPPETFLATPFSEASPEVSPDGQWISYLSNESGRYEVYLRTFPDTGRVWQVSTEGGVRPLWSPDGREIYYRGGDTVFAVSMQTEPEVRIGRPEPVFEQRFATSRPNFATFDLSPDGKRFILVRAEEEEPGPRELVVVLNFFDHPALRAVHR